MARRAASSGAINPRRYLTGAVFPVYILHQTLTLLLARKMEARAGVEPTYTDLQSGA